MKACKGVVPFCEGLQTGGRRRPPTDHRGLSPFRALDERNYHGLTPFRVPEERDYYGLSPSRALDV
eukprot:14875948-Alexandrium_andersonii.AAC.1